MEQFGGVHDCFETSFAAFPPRRVLAALCTTLLRRFDHNFDGDSLNGSLVVRAFVLHPAANDAIGVSEWCDGACMPSDCEGLSYAMTFRYCGRIRLRIKIKDAAGGQHALIFHLSLVNEQTALIS